MLDFWGQFWPEFVAGVSATLLGLALGIPVGLMLDRRLHARRIQSEQRHQTFVVQTHLKALRQEIARNRDRLNELLGGRSELRIGYKFEVGAWGAIPSDLLHIVPASIASAVPVAYYLLSKINGLQETALGIWSQAFDIKGPDGVSNRQKLLQQLFEVVESDAQEAMKALTVLDQGLEEWLSQKANAVE